MWGDLYCWKMLYCLPQWGMFFWNKQCDIIYRLWTILIYLDHPNVTSILGYIQVITVSLPSHKCVNNDISLQAAGFYIFLTFC